MGEQDRLAKEAELKERRRVEYGIGWKASTIPRNLRAAKRLGCDVLPRGMCCLVYQEDTRSVTVEPTCNPVSAVNLEYLSLALRVRLQQGREPFFSLDPLDETGDARRDWMQVKRFEPEWLAGTSAGEVLFQSDYHLKELSMGEMPQPIVGMKSCFDYLQEEKGESWRAREWFTVKMAQVQLSENNVLVPCCRMAVEAREQVVGEYGREDAPITRQDHPLVRYADEFSRNFDLIAERRSSIFQLRELAKASILAKFLLEADIRLEDTWFNLWDEKKADEARAESVSEIPQLWHDRMKAQFQVRDGKLLNTDKDIPASMCSVYGGVDFSLDRFDLHATRAIARIMPVMRIVPGVARELPALTAPPVRRVARVRPALMPSGPLAAAAQRTLSTAALGGLSMAHSRGAFAMPRGVDLDLDDFKLAEPVKVEGGSNYQTNVNMAEVFWKHLEKENDSAFDLEDKKLLNAVFNPHLSDRRQEKSFFCPPDTSPQYVQALREMIKEEEFVQERRREYFLSKDFVEGDAGSWFPSSWTYSIDVAQKPSASPPEGGAYFERRDFLSESSVIGDSLKCSTPVFDKSTEDGTRYRIYRFSSLEVRTIQKQSENELIGIVFSIRSAHHQGNRAACLGDNEKIFKVTEYVERDVRASENEPDDRPTYHYYVALETEFGNTVVMEKCAEQLAWEENPMGLDARNSMAKVVRVLTVRTDVKRLKDFHSSSHSAADTSSCKRYAEGIVSCASSVRPEASQ